MVLPKPRSKNLAVPQPAGDPHAVVYYKENGRAYGDFRAWSAWGGKQEALIEPGGRFATGSPITAAILFGNRLVVLGTLRARYPYGLPAKVKEYLDREYPKGISFAQLEGMDLDTAAEQMGYSDRDFHEVSDEPGDPMDSLAPYVAYHIHCKIKVVGPKRASDEWIAQLEKWLTEATCFFADKGFHRLDQIKVGEVQAWYNHLVADTTRNLSASTLRKMLNALNSLFVRAVREERVSKNPVANLADKPTDPPSATDFLEAPEAALLLEACRIYRPPVNAGATEFLYELAATYLMTGGRKEEVTGLLIGDADFDRNIIWFRPNTARPNMKTLKKSEAVVREVPMPPQLREILWAYLHGPKRPKGPLLFPSADGPNRLLRDFDRALDSAAALAGFPKGSMRTRPFRTTWVSARLQCTDNGKPIALYTVVCEAGHSSSDMVQRVYARLGKVRPRGEHVEFRWDEYKDQVGHRLNPAGVILSPRWRSVLDALPESGATLTEWERAAVVPQGTLSYIRDRLVELGLVEQKGEGRGAKLHMTLRGAVTVDFGRRGDE